MSKYKCIIFDCDGVLVDSESIAIGILVDMANGLGASMNKAEALESLKGKSLNFCMQMISKRINRPLPEYFELDYRALTFKAFKEQIKPITGVEGVLKQLNIPYCVASSGPKNKIRLNLEATGLLPYFEGNIFSCYTIKKWKPDPAVYLWAAKKMGFAPNECLVVEDSVPGVIGAKNGGFDVFGFTKHDKNNVLEGIADKTFEAMEIFFEVLE